MPLVFLRGMSRLAISDDGRCCFGEPVMGGHLPKQGTVSFIDMGCKAFGSCNVAANASQCRLCVVPIRVIDRDLKACRGQYPPPVESPLERYRRGYAQAPPREAHRGEDRVDGRESLPIGLVGRHARGGALENAEHCNASSGFPLGGRSASYVVFLWFPLNATYLYSRRYPVSLRARSEDRSDILDGEGSSRSPSPL
jgi:hypothetical protein